MRDTILDVDGTSRKIRLVRTLPLIVHGDTHVHDRFVFMPVSYAFFIPFINWFEGIILVLDETSL